MRLPKKLGDVFRAKLVENRVVNRPRTGKTGDDLLDNLRRLDSPASFLRLRDIALVNRVNQSNSPPLSEFSLKRPYRLAQPSNKPRHSPLFRIEHAERQCSKNQGVGKRLGNFLFRSFAPVSGSTLQVLHQICGQSPASAVPQNMLSLVRQRTAESAQRRNGSLDTAHKRHLVHQPKPFPNWFSHSTHNPMFAPQPQSVFAHILHCIATKREIRIVVGLMQRDLPLMTSIHPRSGQWAHP